MYHVIKFDKRVANISPDEALSTAGRIEVIGMDEEVMDCGKDWEMAISLAWAGRAVMVETD